MTYLKRCSRSRSFVNKDSRCGEDKPRPCKSGDPRQNSHLELLRLLGPREEAPPNGKRARAG